MRFVFLWKPLLQGVGRTVLGVLVAVLYITVSKGWDVAWRTSGIIGVALLVMYLGFLVAVAVHEGGHWFGARTQGVRIQALRIGPLLWLGDHLEKQPSVLEAAGGFVMPLLDDWTTVKSQLKAIIFFGPVASLALAACVTPLMTSPTEFARELTPVTFGFRLGLWAFAGCCWAIALLNFLPYQYRGILSDGFQLVQLSLRDGRSDRFADLAYVSSRLLSGKRFKNLEPDVIERLAQDPSQDDLGASVHYLAYGYYFDKGQRERGRAEIEKAVALVPKINPKNDVLRQAIWVEGAFSSEDPVVARDRLERALNPPDEVALYRLRAEAKVLFLEGRSAEARAKFEEFLVCASERLKRTPERVESARESVADLVAALGDVDERVSGLDELAVLDSDP